MLEAGAAAPAELGYGPLRPMADATTGMPLLELPEGFRYMTFGWTGDPMDDGRRIPPLHDGMAAFAGENGRVVLVRNHEIGAGVAFEAPTYDSKAGGGTTTTVFDPATEKVVSTRASLSGHDSQLRGRRRRRGARGSRARKPSSVRRSRRIRFHSSTATSSKSRTIARSNAKPIKAMGCFVHEAVAIDPQTGIVYQTQDRTQAGLFRYVPKTRGKLADGGRLQMLAVDGRRAFDTSRGQRTGVTYDIGWVDIPEPDRPHVSASSGYGMGVLQQGLDGGGAIFSRLEGAAFGDGRLYVTATDGGDAKMGQVWEIDPRRERLRLVFESPGAPVLNMPDNLTLSPRGGLVLCEDGTMTPCVHGLTRDGRIFRFARNNIKITEPRNGLTGDFSQREFAGATYSPDGKWLFFNAQTPGITFAVTGPWAEGGL